MVHSLDLDQMMEAPNLPILLERAQAALKTEAQKRQLFYDTIREDHKAEFINGEFIMHSTVKERHWTTVGNLFRLLSTYAIKHKLGRVASEKALITNRTFVSGEPIKPARSRVSRCSTRPRILL
jgi:hypothetical protein